MNLVTLFVIFLLVSPFMFGYQKLLVWFFPSLQEKTSSVWASLFVYELSFALGFFTFLVLFALIILFARFLHEWKHPYHPR